MQSVSSPAALGFASFFVGRVPRGTSEPQLRAAFGLVGAEVGAIELVLDRVTGLPRGFAFVWLRPGVSAPAGALQLGRLQRATLEGHLLDVQKVPAGEARRA